ncbi:MAG: zinc ribbon domain-containing protein [Bacteroidales bacterium]|nr:zinc ribbon domain-containing protein [Bacteroidales bacterium]
MALIECSNCGQPVSDKAVACPHCGAAPNAAKAEGNVKFWWIVLDFLIPLVGIILYFAKKPNPATAKSGLYAAIVSIVLGWLLL